MTDQSDISALPDPSQAMRRQLLRLPKNAASFILSALSAASWFMAPLNLLNFLTGLKSAAELWAKIVAWCAHLPFNAAALLHGLEGALNFVFGPWRALIAPLRAWLSGFLPTLPHFAADLLLMALISLPALLRLVANLVSAQFHAAGLVNDIDKIVELGEPGDALNAEIHAELNGARRFDVLAELIYRRSHEWSEETNAAVQKTLQDMQAAVAIDPDAPADPSVFDEWSRVSPRNMVASRAAVHMSTLVVERNHVRSSLRLLRYTAILSLIGAAVVTVDYLLR